MPRTPENRLMLPTTRVAHRHYISTGGARGATVLEMSERHGMLLEYERLHREATGLHGERVVLLLQVGSFWEMYWYQDEASETAGAPAAAQAAATMGIAITRATKRDPGSLRNPSFSGFPMAGPDKWTCLLDDGWTVAFGRQIDAGGRIARALAESASPSMRAREAGDGNYACCVYVDAGRSGCALGVALLDVATGSSTVVEVAGSSLLDCVGRLAPFIAARDVSEAVLVGGGACPARHAAGIADLLASTWRPGTYVHDKTGGRWDRDVVSRSQTAELLRQAYGASAEALHLSDRPCARGALAYLLHFTRQHALRFGTHLPLPDVVDPSGIVAFSAHAQQQLGIGRLEQALNCAVTPMGRRLFKSRMRAVSSDAGIIGGRLDAIVSALSEPARIDSVRRTLSSVGDLQRWARLVRADNLELAQADAFRERLTAAAGVAEALGDEALRATAEAWVALTDRVACDGTALAFPDLAGACRLSAEMTLADANMESVRSAVHRDARLVDRERLELTHVRWGQVEESVRKHATVTKLKSNVRVHLPELADASQRYADAERALNELQAAEWSELLQREDPSTLDALAAWISTVDVTYAGAHLALRYGHVRPQVAQGPASEFRALGLGNPVAERAMEAYTSEAYVRNDVTLDADEQHVLLFGINSSGKSTLMRGIGACIIMAQAGLFVPCTSLELTPFARVDTRILTADDVDRGLSSFTAEVMEMREAMRAAGPRSLLLADELCNSTEHLSAAALVGTLIRSVGDRGSRTFVTTHFHELLEHPALKPLLTLRIKHMSMRLDPAYGWVYERRLVDGPCEQNYGIVVASSLGFDARFIREATEAREALSSRQGPNKAVRKSRYNRRVVMGQCERCDKEPAVDTHHIAHRADAVDGRHGTLREHARSNLMPLCKACHDEVHALDLHVGRVHTLTGPIVTQI
jgi:DNA mismatch repair protein MutS